MAKLYFRYGAMGSSKTANALMVAFNYRERGQEALLLKTDIDLRDGYQVMKSRIGLSAQCSELSSVVTPEGEIISAVADYDCIIVDEAQFCTKEQVNALVSIVDLYGIPVICYGLRTDFRGELFAGSERLMAVADKIEEIKTVCWCGRKATFNARYNSSGILREGEQIVLGGNEKYVALCRKHYHEGKLHE